MLKYTRPLEDLSDMDNEIETKWDGTDNVWNSQYSFPYPLTNGIVEIVKRFLYTWMNIDYMLMSLTVSHREKHWFNENYRGISEEQLIWFRHFTKFMTIEEKRNPQWLSEERILELAEMSGVHEYHISILVSIFHLRYRSNTIYYIPIQTLLLKYLHRSKDLHRKIRYELLN